MREPDVIAVERQSPLGRGRTAAVVALLLTAVTGCASDPTPPGEGTPTPTSAIDRVPTQIPQDWVAFTPGWPDTDISLVRAGEPAHRIFGSDDDGIVRICPAFEPHGSRLAFGEATGSDEAGWTDAALVIADVTADGAASVAKRIGLDGLDQAPCPVWSPDGRWAAFGADIHRGPTTKLAKAIWVVDIEAGELHTTIDVSGTDIEWTPNGSELYIAGETGISVYTLADAGIRTLDDTGFAETLTMSPDGQTLAVQRRKFNAANRYDLWLMDADGTDQRIVVSDYTQMHGIGPVWSPDGAHVVFQRSCETITYSTGEQGTCSEEHDVVLVTVTDDDPAQPVGAQTVIARPETGEGDVWKPWFPYSVSWSPDSTTLLYLAWTSDPFVEAYADGLLAVPVRGAAPPLVLHETAEGVRVYGGFPMNNFQSWSG